MVTKTKSGRGRKPAQKKIGVADFFGNVTESVNNDDETAEETPTFQERANVTDGLVIGRVVHYVQDGPLKEDNQCSAAIVTYVLPTDEDEEPIASLFVMSRNNTQTIQDIMHNADNTGRSWHWPNECYHQHPELIEEPDEVEPDEEIEDSEEI